MEELICKFSKKGLTPSQIGVLLRDNHGIAQVSTVTTSKVLRILKGHGTHPASQQLRLGTAPGRCETATLEIIPRSPTSRQASRPRSRRTCIT